jgi:hypothetical protein
MAMCVGVRLCGALCEMIRRRQLIYKEIKIFVPASCTHHSLYTYLKIHLCGIAVERIFFLDS